MSIGDDGRFRARNVVKRPKLDPLSERGLRRKTELYLRRYWPSVVQMRRVLVRHIDRNIGRWGGDREAALARLDPLLDELTEQGVLNDERFTRSWVEQLDRKGLSRLAIVSKMREKGIERDLVDQELRRIDDFGGNRELLRAIAYAKRRRLGAAQRDSKRREIRREKDLAAMARAGFRYGIARQVIESDDLDCLWAEAEDAHV